MSCRHALSSVSCCGFNAESLRERPALLRFHLCGLEDDESANGSEGDLAENEPWPIDAYGKFGINDVQRGSDQSGPDQGSYDAAPEPFEAGRQHGKKHRVKKAHQDGDGDVSDRADNQSGQAELPQSFQTRLSERRDTGSCQEIDRITRCCRI